MVDKCWWDGRTGVTCMPVDCMWTAAADIEQDCRAGELGLEVGIGADIHSMLHAAYLS